MHDCMAHGTTKSMLLGLLGEGRARSGVERGAEEEGSLGNSLVVASWHLS